MGGGEQGRFEEHKLTMTYPIGASVTGALLDAVRQSLSIFYLVVAGRARASCDAMRHGHGLEMRVRVRMRCAARAMRCDEMRCRRDGPIRLNEQAGWAGLPTIGLDWTRSVLIDWCCKLQGEQASNWPKSRQSGGARVGGGRRRVGIGRKWADWLGTLFEGEGAKE